jgi:hypothetical protein
MKKTIFSIGLTLLLTACGGTRDLIPLQNPSFNADPNGAMTGWSTIEHGVGKAYTFVADPVNAYSAPSSARIKRHGVEPFALLEQRIRVDPSWSNRMVRLSGFLKSEGIDGAGGALAMRIDNAQGTALAWSYMENARVKGTQDWKPHSIELKIPPGANEMRVGVMLEEGGTLWADDLMLELGSAAAN